MSTPESLDDFYRSLRQTGFIGRLLELARDEDLGPDHRDLLHLAQAYLTSTL